MKYTTPRVNHNGNYRFGVLMIGQYRLSIITNIPCQCMVFIGGGVVGRRAFGKYRNCEIKIALENKGSVKKNQDDKLYSIIPVNVKP